MSMDVSSPAWSPGWKGLSLMNMVFAVMLLALPAPGLVSSCTPSINIKRNSKSSGTQGQPVSLRCPVCLCSEEWPNVTWCKVDEGPNNQCNPVKLDHQIISGWEDKKENKGVYVLKFSSVQINDTGFYKCLAAFKEQQIVGSVIQFTVSDTAMATTTPMDMLTSSNTNSTVLNIQVLKQFKIFMYVMVSVGGVCFMIIIISVLVFCYRKRQIKPGSSTHVKLTEEAVEVLSLLE
ncbi:uncharacterized protein [Pyxicephalus adspersus]|uniref:uncharacterized protein n=1 Tax=Pyxicephalus adspersus TaxID=30357 RepID=UPI003B5ABCA9